MVQKVLINAKIKHVLTWRFFLWCLGVFFLVFTAIIWFQNLPLLYFLWIKSGTTLLSKISISLYMYLNIKTNFTIMAAVYVVLIALLSGINAGLMAVYVKKTKSFRSAPTQTSFLQIGGLISAVFGIGCASCGSVILTSILLQFGAGGLLLALPLHGAEFRFLAVGLLSISVILLWRKINQPPVCL